MESGVDLVTATKIALTSMVSTAAANLAVGPPYDAVIYRNGSLEPIEIRINAESPFLTRLGRGVEAAPARRDRRASGAGAGGSRHVTLRAGAFDPIGTMLEGIRSEFADDDRGDVADYIPQLSTADPSAFGLALVGVAGSVYEAGAARASFTIQSISKPFVYALALADVGVEGVLARVGVEPSGEAFNAISLEPGTGRPANPMVNAGAILTTSLIHGASPAERFERIRDVLSRCAGRELDVDEQVYGSESRTGDRNRALAYLMHHAGSLTTDVEEAVDVYFRQCAVLVNAVDLAVMAATLANGGVNPRTGEAVVDAHHTEQVLTVMATCGMYDFSGSGSSGSGCRPSRGSPVGWWR